MKWKTPVVRSVVILTIVALSVLIGIIYQAVWNKIDLKNFPRAEHEIVEKYAETYGVPEYVVYGVMKYESGFASNNVNNDGGVGLMGITEDEFDFMLKQTKENIHYDALYGPETNIKYGVYMLSQLFARFGNWDAVYAAKTTDMATWESWLNDKANYDEDGAFLGVPDDEAAARSEKIAEYAKKYRHMYYGE